MDFFSMFAFFLLYDRCHYDRSGGVRYLKMPYSG
jgi:hypothetical protein